MRGTRLPQASKLSGQVFFAGNLPIGKAKVSIRLLDTALTDAPAKEIASVEVEIAGRPISDFLAFELDELTFDTMYTDAENFSMQVLVYVDGKLAYTNKASHRVNLRCQGLAHTTVVVQPVS
jgi:uncharacterized lipoprotein YbaY